MKLQRLLLFLFSLLAFAATAVADEARTALVVGCDYFGTELQLPSPVRDAKSLAAVLKDQLGFDVSVTDMLTRVNAEVRKVSGGVHIPFMEVGLSDVFAFTPGNGTPAPPPASRDPVTAEIDVNAGATLELRQITTEEELRDENSAKRFVLHIPIKTRPNKQIDPSDLVVHVIFYDLVAGRNVVQTSANVKYRWAKTPVSWIESDTEELQVEYRLPKPDSHTAKSESRKYFGYIVRIYYKQRLQAATAAPNRLAQLYPPPDTLPGEREAETLEPRLEPRPNAGGQPYSATRDFTIYAMKLRERAVLHMDPQVIIPNTIRLMSSQPNGRETLESPPPVSPKAE